MRTHPYRGARALAAATLLGLVTACAEAPITLPLADPPDAALDRQASGFSVVHLHLRSAEESETTARGESTVFVGTHVPPSPCTDRGAPIPACAVAHPPNPCGETLEAATIVCGVIHNPGEELLTGGFLMVQASREAERVVLEFAVPPNPCRTYLVRAAGTPNLGTTEAGGPAVQALFTFERGTIVSVEGTPGPPNDPSGRRGSQPGPPNAPPNPCVVGFATRQG